MDKDAYCRVKRCRGEVSVTLLTGVNAEGGVVEGFCERHWQAHCREDERATRSSKDAPGEQEEGGRKG